MTRVALFVVLVLSVCMLAASPWVQAAWLDTFGSQDLALTPLNVEVLKQERRAILKTVESAQLKVQLHQTQLSLVQLMLQQAAAEVQAAEAQQQAFEARVREALGAKEGDEVDYETMTLVKKG